MINDNKFIKQEYRWLAHYYFKQVEKVIKPEKEEILQDPQYIELAQRSSEIFKKELNISNNDVHILISENNIFLESDTYKLAKLLGHLGKKELQKQVLEELYLHYTQHPSWPWQYTNEALIMLAKAYEINNEIDNANTNI